MPRRRPRSAHVSALPYPFGGRDSRKQLERIDFIAPQEVPKGRFPNVGQGCMDLKAGTSITRDLGKGADDGTAFEVPSDLYVGVHTDWRGAQALQLPTTGRHRRHRRWGMQVVHRRLHRVLDDREVLGRSHRLEELSVTHCLYCATYLAPTSSAEWPTARVLRDQLQPTSRDAPCAIAPLHRCPCAPLGRCDAGIWKRVSAGSRESRHSSARSSAAEQARLNLSSAHLPKR